MADRDRLLPLRRDKTDPAADFQHTLRWGLVIAALILVAVSALTA
jgi:hypothetical protein